MGISWVVQATPQIVGASRAVGAPTQMSCGPAVIARWEPGRTTPRWRGNSPTHVRATPQPGSGPERWRRPGPAHGRPGGHTADAAGPAVPPNGVTVRSNMSAALSRTVTPIPGRHGSRRPHARRDTPVVPVSEEQFQADKRRRLEQMINGF